MIALLFLIAAADAGVPADAGPAQPEIAPLASPDIAPLVPPAPAQETGFAADHHCAFWDSLRR